MNQTLGLGVSSSGNLFLDENPPTPEFLHPDPVSRIRDAFVKGKGFGLLHLGLVETGTQLPSNLKYWRDFASQFVSDLCQTDGLEENREKIDLPFFFESAETMIDSAPPMNGGEYLRVGLFAELWHAMLTAFREEIRPWKKTVQEFFRERNPVWNLVGRVCFHLAENRSDQIRPFAFLATYTVRLNDQAKPQHSPLGNALKQFGGDRNKTQLIALLSPVQSAAQKSDFLRDLLESGNLFQPLAWKPREAYGFLREIPKFETSGIVCRVPNWWKAGNQKRLQVTAKIGDSVKGGMGLDSILDFSVNLVLDGQPVSPEEWEEIRAQSEGLALIRGQWVELDPKKLDEVLSYWQEAQKLVAEGLSFRESMRLLAGAPIGRDIDGDLKDLREWSQVVAGKWLNEVLDGLRRPEGLPAVDPGDSLKADLRPYQKIGLQWLYFLYKLGLGACLADDMGLGKTMQVLSLILFLKRENAPENEKKNSKPHLLIVPASLISNWENEIRMFSPDIKTFIAHPSAHSATNLLKITGEDFREIDLVITSYGSVYRLPWPEKISWNLIILDEAQAIKNSGTKQTKAVKKLSGKNRMVLTGTPVENRLSDLWSIFDFLNPGLLGTAKHFSDFAKQLAERTRDQYLPLRNLVRPYILRRMKTDRNIITDLPDKTEMNAFCSLSKRQVVLYEESVQSLKRELETVREGIQRRGLVLAYLMRFKQICNHPSQWLRDDGYAENESGKFSRLREIAETISAKQEKVLVFSQFREIADPLCAFLNVVFGRSGLVMHGQTPVKERKNLVDRFQNDDRIPFFVLSVKVGGVGLNLTAASHVIHFDRWWNPAVENQATDRAFRIGQKKNVLVHKFVCRGTIEEKIDALIASKQSMAKEILSEGAEAVLLTEMSNEELVKMLSLDISRAVDET